MKMEKWNEGWKFWPDKDSFALVWDIPEAAREVTLPHDAMIEEAADEHSPNGGNTGFRNGECYTYVKLFTAPKEWMEKSVQVRFEGIYMNAMVYLNGQLIAKRPGGYSVFYANLSDYMKYGEENELRVLVRAGAMTNSRWYSGAGIYRDVYLCTGALACIVPDGIRVQTEDLEGISEEQAELAVIKMETEVYQGESTSKDLLLETVILDPSGTEVVKERVSAFLTGGEKRTLGQRIAIENANLWSEDTPVLYQVKTSLVCAECGKVLDEAELSFGIRTLSLDAKRGLRVNGKEVKLRGACIHHDSGILGAATFEEAQYRQVKLLKEAGFNAIRMSHHPMAPAMLRACDRLGMFVMDELSDMWNRMKSNYDYGLVFEEWWREDVEMMVRKDFNHPSVVLYSIGNEIPEIGTNGGSKTGHEISTLFHTLDPARYTTAGINGVFAAGDAVPEIVADISAEMQENGEISGNVNDFMTIMDTKMDQIVVHPAITKRLEKACASLDVAGYNYMTARYAPDRENYPNRVIVGSETYPPEIARNWGEVEKYPHVIGDFTWTGWDYIGEAGVGIPAYQFGEGGFGALFPAQLAYCGDIDITGFRRPASYFRQIVFGLRKEPYLAVQNPYHYGENLIKTPWVLSDSISSWTYPGCEGRPVIVEVYAPGEETELFLNGKSLGKKASGKKAGFRTFFEVDYEPGELCAVVYEKGQEMGRTRLFTTGNVSRLSVEKEEEYSGEELAFLSVELVDENGRAVMHEEKKITVSTEQDAEVWIGSGNPKPKENYNSGQTETWHGRAQIIVRKKGKETVELLIQTEDDMMETMTV